MLHFTDSLNSGSPVSRGRRSLQQYNPVPLSPSAQQIVNIVNGVIDGTIDPATLGLTVNQIITNIDAVSATGAPLSGQQVSEVSQAVGSSAGGVESMFIVYCFSTVGCVTNYTACLNIEYQNHHCY